MVVCQLSCELKTDAALFLAPMYDEIRSAVEEREQERRGESRRCSYRFSGEVDSSQLHKIEGRICSVLFCYIKNIADLMSSDSSRSNYLLCGKANAELMILEHLDAS